MAIAQLIWGGFALLSACGFFSDSEPGPTKGSSRRDKGEAGAASKEPLLADNSGSEGKGGAPVVVPGAVEQTFADVHITPRATLVQPMDGHDAKDWQMADWANGSVFNTRFRPDHVEFREGVMILRLDNRGCPVKCDGYPFASAEYRTVDETFGYGSYEVRMQAASGSGVNSSFFIYRGTYGKSDHDEIDFEFLGRDTARVQTNYHVNGIGTGAHEQMIDLGFDASKGFHSYGFQWSPEALVWYVDGREVRRVTEDPRTPAREIPYRPGKVMANLWTGTEKLTGWLGPFTYPGRPIQARYDWIRIEPVLGAAPASPSRQAAPVPRNLTPEPPPPALLVEKIQGGSFTFNGGNLTSHDGTYNFTAKNAKDAGAGILTGNTPLGGRNTLKFDIKGNVTRHGGYARFIVQVYRSSDDDASPSVALDPVPLSDTFSPVSLDLRGRIPDVKKVQLLLVTDNGSCDITLTNLRFE